MIHHLSNGQVYDDDLPVNQQTEGFQLYLNELKAQPPDFMDAEPISESKNRFKKISWADQILSCTWELTYLNPASHANARAVKSFIETITLLS
jgi:hypothetical protein